MSEHCHQDMKETLHQAILEEVNTCLVDYRDAIERLEELSQNESGLHFRDAS